MEEKALGVVQVLAQVLAQVLVWVLAQVLVLAQALDLALAPSSRHLCNGCGLCQQGHQTSNRMWKNLG